MKRLEGTLHTYPGSNILAWLTPFRNLWLQLCFTPRFKDQSSNISHSFSGGKERKFCSAAFLKIVFILACGFCLLDNSLIQDNTSAIRSCFRWDVQQRSSKITKDGDSGENICGFGNWIYCVYAWTQNSICSHTWRQIEFSVLIHNIYPKTQWNVNCHRNQ